MNSGGILAFLISYRKKWIILAAAAVGVILLLLGSLPNKKGDEPLNEDSDMFLYAESLEQRIVSICEKVEGVSDVSVLLTLDGGNEHIYAENSGSGGDSYVIVSVGGEEKTVLIREVYASVRGIAVVCKGGEEISVQRTLTDLLSCALGVPISKISVAGAGR